MADTTNVTVGGQTRKADLVATFGGSGSDSTTPSYTADATGNKTDRSITASTTSQQAAAANASRRRLIVQNQDAAINIHINVGAVATTGAGSIKVLPNQYLEITGTTQAVNVIAASGTPIVTIWEF